MKIRIIRIAFKNPGFSMIEVILAVAIFVIFSTGILTLVLGGYNANRLGYEKTIATQFAAEGMEAVRSIKNQAFSNLITTASTSIARNVSNVWAFAASTPANSTIDKYTRAIKVETVNRDNATPKGNIVGSGGSIDVKTKKITSTVTWNFSAGRAESVVLTDYLSDWKRAIPALGDGLIIYGDTTSVARPKHRFFTDSTNTFNAQADTGTSFIDVAVGKTFKIKTSPLRKEAIAGYVNNSGVLRILCFDGDDWTTEWTVSVGGTGTNDQRFGIAYENTSGDVLVVYSKGVASPASEMAYRTKLGTTGCASANWTAETPINTLRTAGIVQWIRLEANPVAGSNNIAVAWADNASDLSAMEWTGASFGIAEPAAALETNLERVTASQDVQSFDMAFESATGNLMIVWGLSQAAGCTAQAVDTATLLATNCMRYMRYAGSWGVVRVVPVVADPATNIDISANPSSSTNQLVVASTDNSQTTLSVAYWSGAAWTGFANVDTSTATPVAGSKLVSTGWLISGATTRYIVLYNDSGKTNITGYVGGPTFTTAPAKQNNWFTPAPVFANPQTWYDVQVDPLSTDRLMFTLSDNASDLFAKRLTMTAAPVFTWSNSDGGVALEASLGQATTGPFGFAFWRQ